MDEHGHEITIHVNEKPVVVNQPRLTGREIKQAAIAQGVHIELDFVLSIELHGHVSRVVGDDEVVNVHPGSRFLAVAPDDNS